MSTFNPLTAALDAHREATEATTETLDRSVVAPDRLERMREVEVGQTPSEVVYTENKLELLHYEPMTEEQHDVPILIVYALINKPYILDLQPDRSVVRRLLEAGHDVYLIDWNEPSRLDKHLTLDDYVNRYIDNCVDVVRDRSGQDAINILGYCMGGTMSAMYAALHREKVRTLGLMAAGLCFAGTGGVLEQWGSQEYFDPDDVKDALGNMPAEMLDVGFALMDPVSNYVSKYIRLMDNLENEDFVDNFARMEKWLSEGIDLAGEAYVQFLTDIYQDNKLYNNELYLDGKHVDVTDIDMPVLQIMGEYDHLIPAESSAPFNDVVGSDDVTTIEYPTGHIGLSVSGSSHRDVWPKVAEWYFERSPVEEAKAEGETEAEPETESEAAEAEVETDEAEDETGNGEVEAEPSPESTVPEAGDKGVDPAAAEGEDLEEIEGIGPTYAERLREGGIETIADLATAEAEMVADLAEIGTERAGVWVDRAQG